MPEQIPLMVDAVTQELRQFTSDETIPRGQLLAALQVALTGLVTSNTSGVLESDTILQALGKLQAQTSNKVDKVAGKTLSTEDYTSAEKTKLGGIAAGAQVNAVTSVAGRTGAVVLAKADVGLSNVDNTADSAKPVSTAQQTALNLKANLASPHFTGNVTAESSPASVSISALQGSNPGYESRAQGSGVTAGAATIAFHRPGAHAVNFGLDTDNKLKVGGWSMGANAYAIYHENNKPTKADVGLSNVDNTADSAKPVSTAQQTALNLKANLASPALTGTPTAPTAADGTSTTQIATTAFVHGAVGGFLSKTTTGGTTTLTTAEASNPIIKVSGALTSNAILEIPVASKRNYSIENATTGAFTLTVKHVGLTPSVLVAQGKRNIVMTNGIGAYDAINDFESISLTGVPTTTTAAVNTNTTQIASTAFVIGQAATAAPAALGTASVGNSTRFARENHVHAMPTLDALANTTITSNTTGEILRWNGTAWVNATLAEAGIAPVASPSFSGTPTAPTAAAGTNTTQVATTAFVQSAVSTTSVPFASAAENAGGTVENKAVDPLGIREAFNATGAAPVFACRAWANINGTGAVTLRGSGNVSSVTWLSAGNYRANFATPMPDTAYAVLVSGEAAGGTGNKYFGYPDTTARATVLVYNSSGTLADSSLIQIAVFR